jgi:RNA polymerase sigma-70 factor (sigma-E family)
MRPDRRDDEFCEYVSGHRSALVRTATLLAAGDSHLAEDLVQISLTKLYIAWPRIRSQTREAYVRRTLVHVAIDESRRRQRRPESPTDILPELVSPAADTNLVDGRVLDALAELPARMRAAVVMLHWLDLDVESAAVALGCRAGTVKSQASRGVAKLRVLLEPVQEGRGAYG